jgi:hypothetical protein
VIIGGTSRGANAGAGADGGAGRDSDMVVGGAEVTGEGGVTSVWEGEVDAVGVSSAAVELLLASSLRVMPRTCWISSEFRPFDSRNETLRSVGASRIDSSSKNLDAWSRRACRGVEVVAAGASSAGDGDGDSSAALLGLCHEGIDALEVSSGMMEDV